MSVESEKVCINFFFEITNCILVSVAPFLISVIKSSSVNGGLSVAISALPWSPDLSGIMSVV